MTKDMLRQAWKDQIQKHHPDKGGKTEWAQAINAAYDKIKFMNGWS